MTWESRFVTQAIPLAGTSVLRVEAWLAPGGAPVVAGGALHLMTSDDEKDWVYEEPAMPLVEGQFSQATRDAGRGFARLEAILPPGFPAGRLRLRVVRLP